MSGTLVSVYSPSASSVAAISLSTEFFAPGTHDLAVQRAGCAARRSGRHPWAASMARRGRSASASWPRASPRVARRSPCRVRAARRRTQSWPAGSPDAARRRRRRATATVVDASRRRRPRSCRPRAVHRLRADGRDGRRRIVDETTRYRLVIPWFGWLFALADAHARCASRAATTDAQPWWAPPDRLTPRQAQAARPARRGVDDRRVRQHAVHPDRQLRRRRLRHRRDAARASAASSCAAASCSPCRSRCSPTASAGGG